MKQFKLQNKKKHNYFEGYYTRVVDEKKGINYAFIFAKTHDKKDPHAFIQIFDGKKNTYLRFDLDAFSYTRSHTVIIDTNELSPTHLKVKHEALSVDVTFENCVSLNNKSAMGYLSKFPLQCYQEVIYMQMRVKGTFKIEEVALEIDAQGYMEKTYGRRFPKRWFWLQANHFDSNTMLSMAGGSVPTLVVKPFGFFALFIHNGTPYVFGTYNLSRIRIKHNDDKTTVFTIKKGRYKLVVQAEMVDPVELVGPSDFGVMNLPVYESLVSKVSVRFYKKCVLMYEGKSTYAGHENMLK